MVRKTAVVGFLVLSFLAAALMLACGSDDSKGETLYVGGIPDQDTALLVRRFGSLADYLGERLGVEVEYVPSVDYAAVVTGFKNGDIHLAWYGGLTGVQARNAVPGAHAIAQRPRDERFLSVFVVGSGVDAGSLADLEGLTFTFGSESSTSGHLMPRHFLLRAGVDPDADFRGLPNFSGSHDKTWKLVESGAYQAGALNEAVWTKAVEEGRVDLGKVRLLQTTEPYYDYNWTVRPDLDDAFGSGFTDRLRDALLTMSDDADGRALLEAFPDRLLHRHGQRELRRHRGRGPPAGDDRVSPPAPAVSLRAVGKSYAGTVALAPLSLEVGQGERVAVLGPSGSGKTTLLHLVAGVVRPDAGTVTLSGRDLAGIRPGRELAALVGVIHQQFDLVPHLPVLHNVLAGRLGEWGLWRSLLSLAAARDRGLAVAAVERVGIADKLHERTSRLSGGEQQRVALARLLVQRPGIVLADEPVSSLDPARADDIVRLLTGIVAESENTLIASLHSVGLARRYFTRAIGLRDGRLKFDVAMDEVEDATLRALYDLG